MLSKAKSRRCPGASTRSVCSLSQGDPRETCLPNHQRERSLATARRPLPHGLSLAREQAALPLTRSGRLCRGPPLRAGPFRWFRAKCPKFVILSHFQIWETVPPAKIRRVPPGRSAGATSRRHGRTSVKSRVSKLTDSFKNFYGSGRARFPKTCAKEKSGFSTVVPVTIWSAS